MTSRSSIDAFLAQPAFALVGMSRSGKKFGNAACRELRAKGYRVYPVHPSAETIDGVRCVHDFASIIEPIDAVLIVVPPAQALEVMREAARAGIHHVWLQQGAESDEAIALGRELGLDVVAGECVLMFAHPNGIHNAHRWVMQLLHRIPPSAESRASA